MEKNYRAFQRLINRYETITLEEIQYLDRETELNEFDPEFLAKMVTGFGSIEKCVLCQEAIEIRNSIPGLTEKEESFCPFCVYYALDQTNRACFRPLRKHDTSYDDILDATTPQELLDAYRTRAEEMKVFYNENYPQGK